AQFVLVQIRVGGQEARLSDETVPLACGCIGQETTGAGGLAKALRTVPVVLEIAERAREVAADDAWIVDFTNPVGIVTRALLDAGHRAAGLCNVAIGFQRTFARWLQRDPRAKAAGGGARSRSFVLPALLPRPRSHARPAAGRHSARGARRRDRGEAARAVSRPGADGEARVVGAARRRLLQRGRCGARLVALAWRRCGARGRRAQRGDTCRPRRRRRGRGAGPGFRRPDRAARAGAARPPAARARPTWGCH